MSLDLNSTAAQIEGMAVDLKARHGERERHIQNALRAVDEFRVDTYAEVRREAGGGQYLDGPDIVEPPSSSYSKKPVPSDFRVVSSDGSHIEVDRHLAVRCFLINVGVSVLTYGSSPNADLHSRPLLYASDEELVIRDVGTGREQVIEGAVLGAKRAVEEIGALVEIMRDLTLGTPSLALMDGSLVMMGLVGHGYHDFVLQELIENGFVESLGDLRGISGHSPFALASYISLPGHADVVSALRMTICSHTDSNSELRCGSRGPGSSPCDRCVGGVLDRDIYADILKPGERSAVFGIKSPVIDNYYFGTGISFFYVHVGEEIGRVEVPSWVSDDPVALELAHSLVVDQCDRGRGYPVALMEAHEQAVVGAADRRYFVQLVERALHEGGTPIYTSEKARSKRLRWL